MTFLNRHRSRIRPVGPFAPSSLFFGGIPGAWYDPTDLSTMFQDSTGTTPVTAVEQPVGLILDKSQGLALGAELVTNGDFSGGTTGWSVNAGATLSVSGGVLRVTTAAGGVAYVTQSFATTVGKTYRVEATIVTLGPVFTGVRKSDNATASSNVVTIKDTTGAGSGVFVATAATTFIVLQSNTVSAGQFAEFDNISVRELAGNHASQSTAASRPTYRARYNLLTYSEQFENAAWVKFNNGTGVLPVVTPNAAVAPDGTTTADLIVFDRGVGNTIADMSAIYQTLTVVNGTYTQTVWLKAATAGDVGKQLALRNVQGSTYSAVTLTADWVRYSLVQTGSTGQVDIANRGTITTGNSVSALVWGAQLLTAADVTATGNAYQRIAAATVYDTAPVFRPYLAFDGMDDSLSTAAINFTSTDKMSVFSGLAKNTDATTYQLVAELSASVNTNNGAFALWAPGQAVAGGGFEVSLRGTSLARYAPSGYAAPINVTLTALLDIGAATLATEIVPRVNGTVVQTTPSGGAGTGNFGTYPLFIGRRNNASLPFNGRLYSLIVRGAASSVTEIADTELWVNARTGAF